MNQKLPWDRSWRASAKSAAILLHLLGLAACGALDGEVPAGSVSHPTQANLPAAGTVNHLFAAYDGAATRDIDRVTRHLTGTTRAFEVGKEKGTELEMLGEVKGAGFDSEGNLYVLDSGHNRVMVYSPAGRLLAHFGRPGRGPNEFLNPNSLAVSNDKVFVADRAGVMKVFRRDSDQFELDRTIPSLSQVQGICMTDAFMFAAGWTAGSPHVVHQLTLDGQPVRSFGEPYRDSSEVAELMMNKFVIGCNSTTGAVVVMNSYMPYMRGYSPDGRLLWTSQIPEWNGMELLSFRRESGEDAFRRKLAGETDTGWNIIDLGDEHVLLQVLRRNRTPLGSTYKMRSYVVSTATGAGVFAGEALPLTLAGTRNRFAVAENTPFPRVVVHAARN